MIFIGKLLKTRGNKGELVLSYSPYIYFSAIKKGKELILKSEKYEKLFEIENTKNLENNRAIIKLKTIDSINSALSLVGYSVYMKGLKEEEVLKEFINYDVFDTENKKLGKIVNLISSGRNELIEVESDDNTFLIPFAEELIKQVNHELEFIIVDLPQGLIDLNK